MMLVHPSSANSNCYYITTAETRKETSLKKLNKKQGLIIFQTLVLFPVDSNNKCRNLSNLLPTDHAHFILTAVPSEIEFNFVKEFE